MRELEWERLLMSKYDEMINPIAKELYRMTTPIHDADGYQLAIYDIIGSVMQPVDDVTKESSEGMAIVRGAWMLDYWEDLYDLPDGSHLTTSQRINRVLTALRSVYTISPRRLKDILNSYSKGVDVDDSVGYMDYWFNVIMQGSSDTDLPELISALEEYKPAHLNYKLERHSKGTFCVGISQNESETLTIYSEEIDKNE